MFKKNFSSLSFRMSWIRSRIVPSISSWVPQVTQVRYRYHAERRANGPLVRRHGYTDPINIRGLLPRESDERIKEMPIYRPKNLWCEKRALFGQNDYIDILGDDNLHPTRILYGVPAWIRGFGGNEFQMLIHKRKVLSKGETQYKTPKRWMDMVKRMKYLYKFLNRKVKTGF